MGKSYRKHDIMGNGGCKSEKYDKRKANRKLRTKTKRLLRQNPEIEILPVMREISDVWVFGKDGKSYFGDMLRGNKRWYPHTPWREDEDFQKWYREYKSK